MPQSPNCVEGSKDETGGSLGVLVTELQSTEYSSSEDHAVDTDDNVELLELGQDVSVSKGVEYVKSSIFALGTEYCSWMSGLDVSPSFMILSIGSW